MSEQLVDYRYDEIESPQALVDSLIESRGLREARKPFGLFILPGNDPSANLARVVEREVLEEYFGNDSSTMVKEYGEYDPFSKFLLIVDQLEHKPSGVMRLVYNSPKGLKTLNDMKPIWGISQSEIVDKHHIDLNKTVDIATLTAAIGYRSRKITPRLYWGLYNLSLQEGIENWVAILDEKVRGLLLDFGIKSDAICEAESREYLGSAKSTPVIINVKQVAKDVRDKSWVNYMVLGKGIGLRGNTSNPW